MTWFVALLAAASFPTHVPVSLTQIPGNICCPKSTRAMVSTRGVLTQYTMNRGASWTRVGRRHLTKSELGRLRTELARFNPAALRAPCPPMPIGDIGGRDLKVGRDESPCPPKSASRLISLLSRWLPKS